MLATRVMPRNIPLSTSRIDQHGSERDMLQERTGQCQKQTFTKTPPRRSCSTLRLAQKVKYPRNMYLGGQAPMYMYIYIYKCIYTYTHFCIYIYVWSPVRPKYFLHGPLWIPDWSMCLLRTKRLRRGISGRLE